ncbi:MAG: 3-oxoacyl-[acyl-carrier-protein] reductase FabG [Pseudomonadota bacterium]|jgi:NAD(P)-dependent dehydrogenase (short-subunit alcohol dehydrogenase family)
MGALDGRLALVTGGTRGIGEAVALRLFNMGARVIVTGRQSQAAAPAGCEYRAIDFDDLQATSNFALTMAAEAPDILINNAGINRLGPASDISLADYERLHRVNVLAPIALSRALVPAMRARGWGRVINIASIWSLRAISGRAAYASSKFGLDGFSAALAAEVAADGVLVNCVSPGFVDTELLRRVNTPEQIAALVAQVPMRRLAQASEIAAFVAWLASPENTYISGQNLPIDGGYTRT